MVKKKKEPVDAEVKASDEAVTKKPKTVQMKKGDFFADVHPDEVENYASGGFIKV